MTKHSASRTTGAHHTRESIWAGYVRRIADGDELAMARLYDESSKRAYRFALRLLGDPADAEEVTLDAYMQVWRRANTYDPSRAGVGAWVMMFTRSRALNRLRDRAVARRLNEPLAEDFEREGTAPDPQTLSEAAESERRVGRAVALLSPDANQLITLMYFLGMTPTEVAAHLGQPLSTVRTRLRRAVTQLRGLPLIQLASERRRNT